MHHNPITKSTDYITKIYHWEAIFDRNKTILVL